MAVPLLLLIGNTGAVLGAYFHLFKTLHFKFTRVTWGQLFADFKRSSFFFYSRIASTVYSATNTVLLGFVDKAGIVTGYYTSADKIVTTAKNGLSPISDSLYPYMVKNRDFKPAEKLLKILMPIIIAGCCRNFRKAHMRFGFRRGICGNCKYFKGLPACHCRGFAELYFRLPRHGSSRNIEICQHLHFRGHGNPYCWTVYFVCNGQFFCGNACRNDLGFGNFHSFI